MIAFPIAVIAMVLNSALVVSVASYVTTDGEARRDRNADGALRGAEAFPGL